MYKVHVGLQVLLNYKIVGSKICSIKKYAKLTLPEQIFLHNLSNYKWVKALDRKYNGRSASTILFKKLYIICKELSFI